MRNLFTRVVVALLIAGPLELAVSAQRSWVEVASPHFTVVSDDRERAARRSPWYTEADRNLTLDAACWGFVHFLMFADKGAHRPRLDRFLSLIQTATTPAAATEEAFGNLR